MGNQPSSVQASIDRTYGTGRNIRLEIIPNENDGYVTSFRIMYNDQYNDQITYRNITSDNIYYIDGLQERNYEIKVSQTELNRRHGIWSDGPYSSSIFVDFRPLPTFGAFDIPAKNFEDAPFNITAPTSNSDGAFTYASSNTSVATVSNEVITIVGAGTTEISATQAASRNYATGSVTASFIVNPIPPTINSWTIPSKRFGESSFYINAPYSNSSGAFTYTSSNRSVATITSDGYVTIVALGTTKITATQAASGNYTTGSVIGSFEVLGMEPTITNWTPPYNAINGDDPFYINKPTSNSNGAFSYTSSNTSVATINSDGLVTIIDSGFTYISAIQAASGNYSSIVTAPAIFYVDFQLPSLGPLTIPTKKFGDSRFYITAPTSNSNGEFSYYSSNKDVATVTSDGYVTIRGVGTTTITSKQDQRDGFGIGKVTAPLVVLAIAPTIGNLTIPSKNIEDSPFNITAPTSNSNGAFTYTSSNTSVATITNREITIRGVGRTTITATQAASGNYTTGTVTALFEVLGIEPTIGNLTIPSKNFGDSPFNITAPTSNSNGAFTYTSSNTSVATITNREITIKGVGRTTITATQAASGNYTTGTVTALFEVLGIEPTIGILVIPLKNLGDPPFNLTAPTSNSNGAFTYTISNTSIATITNREVIIKGIGTTAITATQAPSGNYTSGSVTASLFVSAIPPNIGNLIIPTKNFEDPPFNITAPTSNSNGAFTYTSSNTSVATITNREITIKGVGRTTITATQAASGNYTTGSVTGLFEVNPIPPKIKNNLNWTIPSKNLGETAFKIDKPNSTSDGIFSYTSDNNSVAKITSGEYITIIGAGTTTITATQAATGNYTTGTFKASLVVKAIEPTINTWTIPSKNFGDAPFNITPPTSNSDGAFSFISKNPDVAIVTPKGNVTIVDAGTAYITAEQAASENYNSASFTATFTVNNTINSEIPGIITNINSKVNSAIEIANRALAIYNSNGNYNEIAKKANSAKTTAELAKQIALKVKTNSITIQSSKNEKTNAETALSDASSAETNARKALELAQAELSKINGEIPSIKTGINPKANLAITTANKVLLIYNNDADYNDIAKKANSAKMTAQASINTAQNIKTDSTIVQSANTQKRNIEQALINAESAEKNAESALESAEAELNGIQGQIQIAKNGINPKANSAISIANSALAIYNNDVNYNDTAKKANIAKSIAESAKNNTQNIVIESNTVQSAKIQRTNAQTSLSNVNTAEKNAISALESAQIELSEIKGEIQTAKDDINPKANSAISVCKTGLSIYNNDINYNDISKKINYAKNNAEKAKQNAENIKTDFAMIQSAKNERTNAKNILLNAEDAAKNADNALLAAYAELSEIKKETEFAKNSINLKVESVILVVNNVLYIYNNDVNYNDITKKANNAKSTAENAKNIAKDVIIESKTIESAKTQRINAQTALSDVTAAKIKADDALQAAKEEFSKIIKEIKKAKDDIDQEVNDINKIEEKAIKIINSKILNKEKMSVLNAKQKADNALKEIEFCVNKTIQNANIQKQYIKEALNSVQQAKTALIIAIGASDSELSDIKNSIESLKKDIDNEANKAINFAEEAIRINNNQEAITEKTNAISVKKNADKILQEAKLTKAIEDANNKKINFEGILNEAKKAKINAEIALKNSKKELNDTKNSIMYTAKNVNIFLTDLTNNFNEILEIYKNKKDLIELKNINKKINNFNFDITNIIENINSSDSISSINNQKQLINNLVNNVNNEIEIIDNNLNIAKNELNNENNEVKNIKFRIIQECNSAINIADKVIDIYSFIKEEESINSETNDAEKIIIDANKLKNSLNNINENSKSLFDVNNEKEKINKYINIAKNIKINAEKILSKTNSFLDIAKKIVKNEANEAFNIASDAISKNKDIIEIYKDISDSRILELKEYEKIASNIQIDSQNVINILDNNVNLQLISLQKRKTLIILQDAKMVKLKLDEIFNSAKIFFESVKKKVLTQLNEIINISDYVILTANNAIKNYEGIKIEANNIINSVEKIKKDAYYSRTKEENAKNIKDTNDRLVIASNALNLVKNAEKDVNNLYNKAKIESDNNLKKKQKEERNSIKKDEAIKFGNISIANANQFISQANKYIDYLIKIDELNIKNIINSLNNKIEDANKKINISKELYNNIYNLESSIKYKEKAEESQKIAEEAKIYAEDAKKLLNNKLLKEKEIAINVIKNVIVLSEKAINIINNFKSIYEKINIKNELYLADEINKNAIFELTNLENIETITALNKIRNKALEMKNNSENIIKKIDNMHNNEILKQQISKNTCIAQKNDYKKYSPVMQEEEYKKYSTVMQEEEYKKYSTVMQEEEYKKYSPVMQEEEYKKYSPVMQEKEYKKYSPVMQEKEYKKYSPVIQEKEYKKYSSRNTKISNTTDQNERMRPNINSFIMTNINKNTVKPINMNVIYDNNIPYTINKM